jgi:predicted transcriptional regulator
MKSVLISIRPEWVEKIVNGEKTIEVRKSAPKELPFKAYIYCTKDRKNLLPIEHGKVLQKVNFWENTDAYYGFGRVIGEFICDKVDEYTFSHYEAEYRVTHVEQKAMCLNQPELIRYGKGKTLYGWHISDLKIYDKPKELNEFFTIADESDCCCGCVWHETPLFEMPCRTCTGERKYLYRPPQSYMFVEEVEEQNNNDN